MAFAMYPGLTQGAIAALLHHATDEQKKTYLPKMTTGEWTGTMNLTEPHCGTDLGMLRSKAVKQADGSYKITGTKIFISAGEHDMSENIIHLVIARIEGAPEGVKGISLFIVPKFLLNADGSIGARNSLVCGSIEHKMGIHANSTCVMNYDGATGWLLGQENKGLSAMFTMMNEARLAVGMQGLAQSEVAYQNAANYARERLQGRAISGVKNPDKPADPIIVHPDIRRVLMSIKSFNEAARALILWTALKGDVQHRSEDEKARQAAEDHMGLLTPVIKGVITDKGFDNTVMAQQVFGGHGYIGEHGMEQFVRDARIAMIYEGANGIQALDLVGRKLGRDGGRAISAFFKEVTEFVKAHAADDAMKPYVAPLGEALGLLQQATMWLAQNGLKKPDNAGAGSTDYMHLFGLVALAYMWAQMAKAAQEKLEERRKRLGRPHEGEARHRQVLHGARAARKRRAPEADHDGRRHHDGIARGGVLIHGQPHRRLPVRRGALRMDHAPGLFEHLLLPHVPEGVRPAVHGSDRRQDRAPDVDARHAVVLPLVQHGAARLLQGLRHAADLRVRRQRPHQRDHQLARRSRSDAAGEAVRHRGRGLVAEGHS